MRSSGTSKRTLGSETKAREALEDRTALLVLPAIALAEALRVIENGRSSIPSPSDLVAAVDHDPRMFIEPVDWDTVVRADALRSIPEMHDRFVAACAVRRIEAGAPVWVLTKDGEITRSGLVPVLW